MVLKFTTHSKKVLKHAKRHGWLPGARYTNLRDVGILVDSGSLISTGSPTTLTGIFTRPRLRSPSSPLPGTYLMLTS